MLDALLCMQIKSCLPFSNSNAQLKPTGIIMRAAEIAARNRMKNWELIADKGRLGLGLRLSDCANRCVRVQEFVLIPSFSEMSSCKLGK
jgi:hypothetical protein